MSILVKKVWVRTLDTILQIFRTLRFNWKLFLGIHLAANGFSLLVLTPVFTFLMGWLVLASGSGALTDEDILFFVLSPTGLLVGILAVALYTVLLVFQHAAMILAADKVAKKSATDLAMLARHLIAQILPLFRLALNMAGRCLAIAIPFLVICVLIYRHFLTVFDINYYLETKPPVFWWAGGFMLLVILSLVIVLLRVLSGWILALPLLLIEGERVSGILGISTRFSVPVRRRVLVSLSGITLLNVALLVVVSLLTDFAVDGVVLLAGESLQIMAYLLGGLLVLWLVAIIAVTFLTSSVLALVVQRLYNRLVETVDELPGNGLTSQADSQRIRPRTLVATMLVVSLSTGVAISVLIQRLETDDHSLIIAHRGSSIEAPENTLAAIELAIKQGADWIEIDVQETREGGIVVIHDRDLKRVGASPLTVHETTLDTLQNVDIGSWKNPSFGDQRVPTLEQVLELCNDRVKLVIELKYFGNEQRLEERVVQLVEGARMQTEIAIISLSYPGLQQMRQLRPEWKLGLISSVAVGDMNRLDVDLYVINARFASNRFVKNAHKRGRQVVVWTVNDPIGMSAMMSKGVDGIITDKPALAVAVRTQRAELEIHERILLQLASMVGKQPTRPKQ